MFSISRYKVVILLISVLGRTTLTLPECSNQGVIFTAEPRDVEVGLKTDEVAIFPCQHIVKRESEPEVQWIINSIVYDSSNTPFPPDHQLQYLPNTRALLVTNIQQWQNGTTYQCQVVLNDHDKPESLCACRSSIGRLIIKTIFEVQISPHYYISNQKQEILSEISTSFTTIGSGSSYNISFMDLKSGQICVSDVIPASSCLDGVCNYIFNIQPSSCPENTDIGVTVTTSYRNSGFSTSTKIDAMNNFFKIQFDESTSSITLKFINQPKESEKHYTVKYGAANPNCRHLPIHTKGHLTNSNSLTVELNINPENAASEICLSVIVTNGSRTVSAEAVYSFGSNPVISHHSKIAVVTVLIVLLIIFITLVFTIVVYRHFSGQMSAYFNRSGRDAYVTDCKPEQDPGVREPIDLSTTFYKLLDVTKECSMYEFGKENFPDYQPERGFGYYKPTSDEVKHIQLHKRVIVMENDVPDSTIISSAFKQPTNTITRHNTFVQERGSRTLHPGDKFLYCARSKEITKISYFKVFNVTHQSKESDFMKEKFSGYNEEWIRYGYYELTEPMYVQPTQSFVVMKKDGSLVKGPGVQHLLEAKDDIISKMTQPPNHIDHPEWKHVFVQSNDGERQLTPDTKYLFCAMMERIGYSVHRAVYIVDKQYAMEEFGRRYNPVFKAELGYGYFEFAQKEFLKPQKNVIIMDKEGRLFTGAGAKLFYTGCKYSKDEIEGKKRIQPPNLKGTEWTHVFVQSHSKERKLKKGTLFLYCEYRTDTYL